MKSLITVVLLFTSLSANAGLRDDPRFPDARRRCKEIVIMDEIGDKKLFGEEMKYCIEQIYIYGEAKKPVKPATPGTQKQNQPEVEIYEESTTAA